MTPGHGGTLNAGSLVRFHLLPSLKEISRGKIIPPTTGENETRRKKEGNVFKKFKFFRVFLFIMNSKKVGGGRLRRRGGNVKSLIQHVKKSLPPTLAG
jgi:hypothetical protein